MNLDLLAFMAIAIYVIRRWSIESAVLNVYLPVLILIPSFYSLRLPHLPGMSAQGLVIYPILIALILYRPRGFRFKRQDLWVVSFCAAAGWSEWLATNPNNGFFAFISYMETMIAPYFLGRMMLEQPGFRLPFIQRMAALNAIVAVTSLPEFVLHKNLYYIIGRRFFTSTFGWGDQPRYGFVRMKGPYPGSINAGLVFLVAILLGAWVIYIQRKNPMWHERAYLKLRVSTWIMIGMIAGSLMTISRGPWLGTILALVIAQVGRAKKIGRTLTVTLILLGVGGILAKNYAENYASASGDVSETQESAVYRKQAFLLYEPIAKKGGYFGWGISSFPRIKGLDSIDNEYLLLRVTQGKIGFWLFLLLFAESGLALIYAVRRTVYRSDILLAFCLAGILAGMMVSIATVYITGQTTVLLFMLFGWAQSLKPNPQPYEAVDQIAPRYEFRRVFA